ncbi:VC0807 family protein, partial [Crossiella equi]
VAARAGWVWLRRGPDLVLALVLSTNAVSLAAALWVGDARLVLLRDPLTSTLVGLVFLASCLLRRPALYYLSRRLRLRPGDPAEAGRLADVDFRRPFVLVTSVWAVALLAEAVVRGVLVFELPVPVVAGLSQVVEIAVLAPVVVWTVWFRKRARAEAQPAVTAQTTAA